MKIILLHIFVTSLILTICKSEEFPPKAIPFADRDAGNKYSDLNVFFANIEKMAKYQSMLEKYRKFILYYIGELDDYCDIYDFITSTKLKHKLQDKSSKLFSK